MQIRNHFRRKCGSQRIEHCQHVDDFLSRSLRRPDLNDRVAANIIPPRLKSHAADGTLESNGAHPPADVHELIHFFQRVFHRHHVSRFRGHVAVLSHGHADGGRHHGRGVVDAVADVERFGCWRFPAHDGQFFFRTLLGVNFVDADLLGQIADF